MLTHTLSLGGAAEIVSNLARGLRGAAESEADLVGRRASTRVSKPRNTFSPSPPCKSRHQRRKSKFGISRDYHQKTRTATRPTTTSNEKDLPRYPKAAVRKSFTVKRRVVPNDAGDKEVQQFGDCAVRGEPILSNTQLLSTTRLTLFTCHRTARDQIRSNGGRKLAS